VERLGHVVIGAEAEPPDLVLDAGKAAAASAILAAAGGGSLSEIETTVAMTASRHLRIRRKGGEELPQRRALLGSGETSI
jgi:hypothetical protein